MKIFVSYVVWFVLLCMFGLHLTAEVRGWPDATLEWWHNTAFYWITIITILVWLRKEQFLMGLFVAALLDIALTFSLWGVASPLLGLITGMMYAIGVSIVEYRICVNVRNGPESAPIGIPHPRGGVVSVPTAGRTHAEVNQEVRRLRKSIGPA